MSDYVDNQREFNILRPGSEADAAYRDLAAERARRMCAIIKSLKAPCDSILDAGCRYGYAMEPLAFAFPAARIEGCDIVPEFVAEAENFGDARIADLHNLPYTDGEFDWVFCAEALEHCHDAPRAAHELLRVAKHGVFVVTDLEEETSFEENKSHYTRHTNPMGWIKLFEHPDWWPVNLVLPSPYRVVMLFMRATSAQQYLGEAEV